MSGGTGKNAFSVVGGGAWGTAIANHLAANGKSVQLWAYEKEVVAEINSAHTNTIFLPGISLDERLKATGDLAAACSAGMIFFVVPSHVMEGIINKMIPSLGKDTIIVSATKGIETKNLRLPSEIFDALLPPEMAKNLVCFSGPSFAKEVGLGLPTAITAASRSQASAAAVQDAMSNSKMRIYTHDDLIGVELGGAVKNVVAVAAGISDGLKLGHNARAAIITRGLAEMTRLGKAYGARADTFSGLSGIGDLILTATGDLSRNRTVGIRLGGGETLSQITDGMKSVAEGILTSKAIFELALKKGADMPVCREVYLVCHEGKAPKEAVADLMGRKLKGEFY
ncbi:MAG: NAD(P)-dependent glycerol-3-phosphate dehydrogenase [Nitrospinae bacterium]|nr:NAD(P)-dependent glycerol-3-phosphate dehydrogenase [Nitrospinota bacterium]